jgi:hypothetical protein
VIEFLVPAALFVVAVVLALYLPAWRAATGPAAELVVLASLFELAARGLLPGRLLPAGCLLVTFVAFVLLRTHRVLSLAFDAGARTAAPDAAHPSARWTASGSRFAFGFDPAAVASSLHLLPFSTVVLLPTLITGIYVPADAQIGTGLVFGLAALAARRFGAVILVLCLCAAFASCFYQRELAHRGETSASVAAASR